MTTLALLFDRAASRVFVLVMIERGLAKTPPYTVQVPLGFCHLIFQAVLLQYNLSLCIPYLILSDVLGLVDDFNNHCNGIVEAEVVIIDDMIENMGRLVDYCSKISFLSRLCILLINK